jgi:hypothetical protein
MLLKNSIIAHSESYQEEVGQKKRLEDVMHLAELCIEVLQQNEEHHAEVNISRPKKRHFTFIKLYHITLEFLTLCMNSSCLAQP